MAYRAVSSTNMPANTPASILLLSLRAASCRQNSSTLAMPLSTMPGLAITFQRRDRKVRMRRMSRWMGAGRTAVKKARPHRNTYRAMSTPAPATAGPRPS